MKFHAGTSYKQIFESIAEWREDREFTIQIKDPYGEFVHLNQDYLNGFNPFGVGEQTRVARLKS
jgi:hypothetical protein